MSWALPPRLRTRNETRKLAFAVINSVPVDLYFSEMERSFALDHLAFVLAHARHI